MVQITARFIIEIAGKPVENVEKALKIVLNKLQEETDKFKIIESFIEDPVLDEKTTLYNGFLEVTARFSDVSKVFGFIMDYTPTSIEVEDPESLKFQSSEFTQVLNDLSLTVLKLNGDIRKLNSYIHSQTKLIKELRGKK